MEIFRTDGSGRSYTTQRLIDLLKLVSEFTDDDFFLNIKTINDHKGDLYIHVKDHKGLSNEDLDVDYTCSVFLTFWYTFNEYSVRIIRDGKIIKSSN